MPTSTAASTQQAPASISDIISALKSRCSLPDLRKRLKFEGHTAVTSWVELESNASGQSVPAKKLDTFLRDFFLEHLLAGERYVKFYDLTSNLQNALIGMLQVAVVPQSKFTVFYPLPLNDSAILSAPSDPTLVDIRCFPNGDYALIYCSAQCYNERLTSQVSLLSSTIQQIYSGYDEIIAVKKVFYQAYDVVHFRASLDRIEIGIDQPSKGTIDFDTRVHKLLAAATENLPDLSQMNAINAWNMFAAISGIFFSPNEGTIKKLSFRTPTGSKKNERMFSPKDDLRKETFHDAGMTAVDNKISPYELVVEYDFMFPRGEAEIKLLATIRDLSDDTPKLFGCYISSLDKDSFLQAANKVIKFINP